MPRAAKVVQRTRKLLPRAGHDLPLAGHVAPRTGHDVPRASRVAPRTGNVAPRAGNVAPLSGSVAPQAGQLATRAGHAVPRAGHVAPLAGHDVPRAGRVEPLADQVVPRTGNVSSRTGNAAPRMGNVAARAMSCHSRAASCHARAVTCHGGRLSIVRERRRLCCRFGGQRVGCCRGIGRRRTGRGCCGCPARTGHARRLANALLRVAGRRPAARRRGIRWASPCGPPPGPPRARLVERGRPGLPSFSQLRLNEAGPGQTWKKSDVARCRGRDALKCADFG